MKLIHTSAKTLADGQITVCTAPDSHTSRNSSLLWGVGQFGDWGNIKRRTPILPELGVNRPEESISPMQLRPVNFPVEDSQLLTQRKILCRERCSADDQAPDEEKWSGYKDHKYEANHRNKNEPDDGAERLMISLTASSSRPDGIFVMDRRNGASIGHCNCLPTVSLNSSLPNRTLTKQCAACLKKRTQAVVEKAMVHSGSRRGVRRGDGRHA